MDLKEIEEFISETKNEIEKFIVEKSKSYSIEPTEVNIFLTYKGFDFEYIKHIHFKISTYIFWLNENESNNSIIKPKFSVRTS